MALKKSAPEGLRLFIRASDGNPRLIYWSLPFEELAIGPTDLLLR